MPEDLEGGRIYLTWGGFLLAVAAVLEAEADVQLPLDCKVGTSCPQRGERLDNQLYGVLKRAGSYLTATWGDGPCPGLPYEGVDDRDRTPVQNM